MSIQIIPTATAAENALAETFGVAKALLPGNKIVAERRAQAFEAFARAGLPNRHIEAWHYTDLRNLMRRALPLVAPPSSAEIAKLAAEASRLPSPRLVAGRWRLCARAFDAIACGREGGVACGCFDARRCDSDR